MIFLWNKLKQTTAFAIVLTGLYFSAQTQNIRVLKDIYGNDLCLSIDSVDDGTGVYFRENGEKILAYKGVMFNGGYKALKEYLDKEYYGNPDYNGRGYNIWEYFFILFDKNLEIVEVRIAQVDREKDTYYYFDSVFIDALKNTNGMWHKTVENKEWYFLICPYGVH